MMIGSVKVPEQVQSASNYIYFLEKELTSIECLDHQLTMALSYCVDFLSITKKDIYIFKHFFTKKL